MSMSDCLKCWDTPCSCGYHWSERSKAARLKQAAVVLGVDVDELRATTRELVPDKHPLSTGNSSRE